MPDAALNAYLAKNYLQGAKAEALLARSGQSEGEKKKRKKKQRDRGLQGEEGGIASGSGQGLRLVDENDESWAQRAASDEEAVVVEDDSVGARKKRSKWNKFGSDLLAEEEQQRQEEQGDDDEDERPQMAGEDGLGLDTGAQSAVEEQLKRQQQTASLSSTTKPAIRAGLKTKEEMRAERLERERLVAQQDNQRTENRQIAEEEGEAERRRKEREERAQETVYRDASGRKIDIRKDDEERKLAREEEKRREREKKDWNKGQVQLERVREAGRREEEERTTDFARYSNDERMNKQLRDTQREADPALNFLTKKEKSRGPQKPSYKGSFPPNRFKIRPGYRWDGVERGNGFEAKYFQRKHQRAHRQEEMDAWGKEDM